MPKSRKKRDKRKAIQNINWQFKMAIRRKRNKIKQDLLEKIRNEKEKEKENKKEEVDEK